jgi:hypothetical protein
MPYNLTKDGGETLSFMLGVVIPSVRFQNQLERTSATLLQVLGTFGTPNACNLTRDGGGVSP